jgi:hypothetical protein
MTQLQILDEAHRGVEHSHSISFSYLERVALLARFASVALDPIHHISSRISWKCLCNDDLDLQIDSDL